MERGRPPRPQKFHVTPSSILILIVRLWLCGLREPRRRGRAHRNGVSAERARHLRRGKPNNPPGENAGVPTLFAALAVGAIASSTSGAGEESASRPLSAAACARRAVSAALVPSVPAFGVACPPSRIEVQPIEAGRSGVPIEQRPTKSQQTRGSRGGTRGKKRPRQQRARGRHSPPPRAHQQPAMRAARAGAPPPPDA